MAANISVRHVHVLVRHVITCLRFRLSLNTHVFFFLLFGRPNGYVRKNGASIIKNWQCPLSIRVAIFFFKYSKIVFCRFTFLKKGALISNTAIRFVFLLKVEKMIFTLYLISFELKLRFFLTSCINVFLFLFKF